MDQNGMNTPVEQHADSTALANGASWVLFAVDGVWSAVLLDRVLGYGDDPVADEPIFTVNGHLRLVGKGRKNRNNQVVCLSDSAGRAYTLVCDEVEEIAGGSLISLHALPPILAGAGGLMQALLLPDKRRVATVIDVDVLADQLLDSTGLARERADG